MHTAPATFARRPRGTASDADLKLCDGRQFKLDPGLNARRDRRECGSAAVELLLMAPVLMLTCLLLMQWAVRLEAERIVDAAAREGAVAAAAWNGNATAGRSTALDYVTDLDPQLSDRSATAVRRAEEAVVTVEGTVVSLIPGLHLHVSATATVPTERFAR